MVYTVTFNPSLDYVVRMGSIRLGEVNRTSSEELLCGGKGINVSIVLQHLGIESVALGFTAGFTGAEIERGVREMGIEADFLRVKKGFSRINVKIKAGEETEINGVGPEITGADIRMLMEKLDDLQDGDLLVLAGSIPGSVPADIYEKILKRLTGRRVLTAVDATGDLLRRVLPYKPFLIKPNVHELEELFGIPLHTDGEIAAHARRLRAEGARNVLVSMAGAGALLVTEEDEMLRLSAPQGRVINSTGAGDSMVAGFLAGYLKTGSLREAFRVGVAAGSASAFSDRLATRQEVAALLEQMKDRSE